MTRIVIIGSGAVAAELTTYIEDRNRHSNSNDQWEVMGYLDSEENIGKYWAKYKFKKPVLADIYSYEIKGDEYFIVGISNIDFRKRMIEVITGKGGRLITFIHPSVIIAETAVLGSGNVIYPFCIIGPNTVIGDNNLVTAYSFISHDCRIGHGNFFSTAGLSGSVTVGDENYFGIRSTVLPGVMIGNKNTIQAGMTVDKNISDDSLIFHRFKEKVIAINNQGKNG